MPLSRSSAETARRAWSGLSKAHAVAHGYSWSGRRRFGWSIGYVVLPRLTMYSVGLPDPRTRAATIVAAWARPVAAAVAMSPSSSFVGDALCPRFVVFGSAVVLVPWFVVCAALSARRRRAAPSERDRVFVVAATDERDRSRPISRTARTPGADRRRADARRSASTSAAPDEPLVDVARARRTVVVLSRAAQDDDDIVLQASTLHEAGVRVRTLSLFYEQWLGKLPIVRARTSLAAVRHRRAAPRSATRA